MAARSARCSEFAAPPWRRPWPACARIARISGRHSGNAAMSVPTALLWMASHPSASSRTAFSGEPPLRSAAKFAVSPVQAQGWPRRNPREHACPDSECFPSNASSRCRGHLWRARRGPVGRERWCLKPLRYKISRPMLARSAYPPPSLPRRQNRSLDREPRLSLPGVRSGTTMNLYSPRVAIVIRSVAVIGSSGAGQPTADQFPQAS